MYPGIGSIRATCAGGGSISQGEFGNLLPNNRRQRRTCYALCHILYPVSAAHTNIFRMDSNSTLCGAQVLEGLVQEIGACPPMQGTPEASNHPLFTSCSLGILVSEVILYWNAVLMSEVPLYWDTAGQGTPEASNHPLFASCGACSSHDARSGVDKAVTTGVPRPKETALPRTLQ
jgi:hypothetical protein